MTPEERSPTPRPALIEGSPAQRRARSLDLAIKSGMGLGSARNLVRAAEDIDKYLHTDAATIPQAAINVLATLSRQQLDILTAVAGIRRYQIDDKGYTAEHDDGHDAGEIAWHAAGVIGGLAYRGWVSTKDRRKQLLHGIALTMAELERLDRKTLRDVAASDQPSPAPNAEAAPPAGDNTVIAESAAERAAYWQGKTMQATSGLFAHGVDAKLFEEGCSAVRELARRASLDHDTAKLARYAADTLDRAKGPVPRGNGAL